VKLRNIFFYVCAQTNSLPRHFSSSYPTLLPHPHTRSTHGLRRTTRRDRSPAIDLPRRTPTYSVLSPSVHSHQLTEYSSNTHLLPHKAPLGPTPAARRGRRLHRNRADNPAPRLVPAYVPRGRTGPRCNARRGFAVVMARVSRG